MEGGRAMRTFTIGGMTRQTIYHNSFGWTLHGGNKT